MALTTRRDGSFLTVTLAGEITMANAQSLKDATRELLETSPEPIFVLDMAGVEFIDSTGIGFLIVLKSRLQEKGKKLVLCKPSQQAQRILELVQLDTFFLIAADEAALAGLA